MKLLTSLLALIISFCCIVSCTIESGTNGVGASINTTSQVESGPCTDGTSRDCHVTIGEHNGVVTCLHGTQSCSSGTWGECSGSTQEQAVSNTSVKSGNGISKPGYNAMAISDAGDCVDNPCDPTCQSFEGSDDADAGVALEASTDASAEVDWQTGDLDDYPNGLVDKGLTEPCDDGSDCQFNTYCDNPTSGTCTHNKCKTGDALASGCDSCVTEICAADANCCTVTQTCAEQFGNAVGFHHCTETDTQCTFNFTNTAKSCSQVCTDYGATCVDAYDNQGQCGIEDDDHIGCNYVGKNDAICICSREQNNGTHAWSSACVQKVHDLCGAFCPEGATCAHDKCTTGTALSASCDSCVDAICDDTPSCCTDGWTQACVDKVVSICGKSCSQPTCQSQYGSADGFVDCQQTDTQCRFRLDKNGTSCGAFCESVDGTCLDAYDNDGVCGLELADHPGCSNTGYNSKICICSRASAQSDGVQSSTGECVPWIPGQVDDQCDGIDLTVGVPCGNTIPVCNVGTQSAPAGIQIIHFPANSQQYPKCDPDQTHPGMEICSTAETIAPGFCINVTTCPGLNGNREIMVNPTGASHVNECTAGACKNNWSLYSKDKDFACGAPSCAGTTSQATLKQVNMFIMVDKSGSMNTNGMWTPAMNALKAFVQDADSAGMGVALRFYPDDSPVSGCNETDCSVAACQTPLVDLGVLTAETAPTDTQEEDLVDAINSKSPGGTTPTTPALDGAEQWAIEYSQTHSDELQVVVLITDGAPNRCNPSTDAIIALAQNAYDGYGVLTYGIGLEGANQTLMDGIASAGGTGEAFYVNNNNTVQQQLLDALISIRGSVVSCEFDLPDAELFDPTDATVTFTPSSETSCPNGQTQDPSTGQCYYLGTDALTWSAARTACQVLGTSYDLVALSTEAESDFITPLTTGDTWIGANDQTLEGSMVWSNGETWGNYTNWMAGAPNNGNGNEDCVQITSSTVQTCAAQYAGVANVDSVCTETDTSCELHFNSKNGKCSDVCQSKGAICTGVFDDNPNNGGCGHGNVGNCDLENWQSAICICSREQVQSGQWDDADCAVAKEYVCEGPPPTAAGATQLQKQNSLNQCGEGWYYDDPTNPIKITLCPDTCAEAQADSGSMIEVELGCPSLTIYTAETYNYVYQAVCPSGTKVQWGYFSYDTTTPGDSSVVFKTHTATTEAGLGDPLTTLATASTANNNIVCSMDGPDPCPIDLYDALGTTAATREFLELKITVNPTSDQTKTAVVNDWEVTYSCPYTE